MVSNASMCNPFNSPGSVEQNAGMLSDKQGGGPGYQRSYSNGGSKEPAYKPTKESLQAVMDQERVVELKNRIMNFHKIVRDLLIENDKLEPKPASVPTLRNWTHLKKLEKIDTETSFLGRVYKCNDQIVIIYQVNSKNIDYEKIQNYFIRGYVLPQFKFAVAQYDEVRKKYPKEKIVLAGYHLGGTIAEYTAFIRRNCGGVTFNGLGVATLYPGYFGPNQVPNIINYVTSKENKILRENHFGAMRILYLNNYNVSASFGGLATKPTQTPHPVMDDFEHMELFQTSYQNKA